MALTELQKRKFKVAFDSQDYDGSGVLTEEDFDAFRTQVQRIIPVTKNMKSLLNRQWYALQSKTDINGDGEVSLEEWYQYLDDVIHDPVRFESYIVKTADSLLESLDPNGDKKISLQEYIKVSRALGVEKSDAEAAFKKLDQSGDGFISIDELKEHIKQFYLNEDDEEAPSNWLFGSF